MAEDIFGRVPADFGGAFAADAAVITFALGPGVQGGVGLLTTDLQVQFMQRITRFYELGSRATFYISGRSEGSGEIDRVLGPRPVTLSFYRTYGNICNARQNTLLFQAASGCTIPGDTGAGIAMSMLGVVLSGYGLNTRAEDAVIREKLPYMFVSLIV